MESTARKSTRASVELIPRFRTPETFDYVQGRCIDLSEGGMFITANLPCESGTLLKFECTVGENPSAVKGVARVVWRRTGDGDRPSGMGLKFVKLEPGSPEVISGLVEHAKAHGMTAPEAPLRAQVRVTESFTSLPAVQPVAAETPAPAVAVSAAAPEVSAAAALVGAAKPESAVDKAASSAATAAPVAPRRAAAPSAATSPVAEPAASSGAAIWIALAVAGALLVWLLSR